MGVPGWGDAGVVVPWRLWQQYGDRRQLRENYEAAKSLERVTESGTPASRATGVRFVRNAVRAFSAPM
jgi:alpha-L-rhamnosidase